MSYPSKDKVRNYTHPQKSLKSTNRMSDLGFYTHAFIKKILMYMARLDEPINSEANQCTNSGQPKEPALHTV